MGVDVAGLQKIPLFASLNAEQREMVASHLEEHSIEEGRHLTTEGGGGYFFFVIEQGTAVVTHDGETVAELGPGDFFGEAAILETPRRTATVTATSPMTVYEMFGADFAKIVRDIPDVGATVRAALEEHLRA
jgi:cAMP-dependent protein kinase regulator